VALGIRLEAETEIRRWTDARRHGRIYVGRMLTSNTLKYLAALTAVLFALAALIGENNDVLWIVDDIVWFGFLLCALVLVVLSAGVLVRSVKRSQRAQS
jgi:hypothetical protein